MLKLLNNLVENCDVAYEYFHMYNVLQTQRVIRSSHIYFIQKFRSEMPPKSNNQKKKEAEAAGKPPKKTKQQENAGKSASQKKAEMQVRGCLVIKSYESRNTKSSIKYDAYFQAKRAADREKKSGW